MKDKNVTYFQHRMKQIGFNPKKHTAKIDFYPDEPMGSKEDFPRFWEDKDGGICIGIMNITGELVTYDKKEYTRKHLSRIQYEPIFLKRKRPGADGPKYLPGVDGMGVWPYLSQLVIDAFKAGEKLETIYLTEGYIKTFVMENYGLPGIGLPGITVWKQKEQDDIFKWIRMVMEVCKPKQIVYITDADTFTVTMEEDKDLAERPLSFYTSIKLYKKFFNNYKADLIWKSIQEDNPLGKGIDDILTEGSKSEKAAILKELEKPITGEWFATYNVGMMTFTGIQEAFSIHNVTNFYKRYEYEIGLNEFIFKRAKYVYSDLEAKVIKLKSEFASMLLMIGNTMYKKATKPTKAGASENVLIPINQKQLDKICGSTAKAKEVFHEIDYYDGAVNRPSHLQYEPYVSSYDINRNETRWYNMFRPVTWIPKQGDITYSLKMIKHIFGSDEIEIDGKIVNSYELGLDYIKILWEMPTQFLPIVTLYSEERATGKTSFWNWMRSIFQQNVKSVRPEQLTGQFTSYFANSLLVIVDEALIDKKAIMERVKGMVTADKLTLEAKFSNAEEVDSFVKVGMGTNNKNFAQIDDKEIRFWVRTVHPLEEIIFDIEEKLVKEIPAFLHYIQNRPMATYRANRAWFAPEWIETSELVAMKKQSKWRIEKEMDEAICTHFSMVRVPVLGLSTRDLKYLVDSKVNTQSDYTNVIENRMGKEKKPYSIKYDIYQVMHGEIEKNQKQGNPYWFYIDEFFSPGEILQILTPENLIILENDHHRNFWNPKKITYSEIKESKILNKFKEVETEVIINIRNKAKSFTSFYELINSTLEMNNEIAAESFQTNLF